MLGGGDGPGQRGPGQRGPGQRGPDDVLEFGRDRRQGHLWRTRAILACLLLVTALAVGIKAGIGSGSGSHRGHPRAGRAARARPGVQPVRIVSNGRHLLGVTASWQLLARGPNELLRIQLAEGRITSTYVPPLQTTSSAISFVAEAHETIIRPADFVSGYVVPDGGPAQVLTGRLAGGGPLIPGPPGTGTAWIPAEAPASLKFSLVTLTGHRAGPVIRFSADGPQLPATAVSDGRGDVLVTSSSFAPYDLGPSWDRRVPGTIIAVGPVNWLTVICDARSQHCHNEVVDSASGARRVLPGATRPEPYFFPWPPEGVIAPDGRTAAVVGKVIAGRGPGPTNAVHLINLRTGVTKDPGVRLGGSSRLNTNFPPQSMAWSPDGRWLFVVATGGNLVAIAARTDQVESLGITLPRIEQVAVRP